LRRGANVNAANDRGITALHNLVKKRFDVQAVWLVMQGADLHQADKQGHSARDLAHSWFQKDLDAAEVAYLEASQGVSHSEREPAAPPHAFAGPEVTLNVVLANANLLPVTVDNRTLCSDVIDSAALQLELVQWRDLLELWEVRRLDNQTQTKRRVLDSEAVLGLKQKWRLFIGLAGDETAKYNYFLVVPRPGSGATDGGRAYMAAVAAFAARNAKPK